VPGTAALFVAGVMLAAFSPSYAAWQESRRRPGALYQALRTAITDAIQTVPGTGTDRGSCQIAVETAEIHAGHQPAATRRQIYVTTAGGP
jgi:hypothetical protein